MKIVTLIPARGGSKGIKDKNIIDLNGKPLIQYSIDASLKSKVDETWVSSDSAKIRKVSESCGAFSIDRSPELSNDKAKTEPTLIDFALKKDFDIMVFLQATSPFINSEYIDAGLDKILNEGYDSVFTVTEEHWIPKWTEDVKPIEWEINNRPRRQDRPAIYSENGMMYVTKRDALINSGQRYSGNMTFLKIPYIHSFQIDTYEDLELIKAIMKSEGK